MPPNLAQLNADLVAAPPAGSADEMVSCVTLPRPDAAASLGWEFGSNAKFVNPVRIAPLAPASAEAGSGAKEAGLPGEEMGADVTAGAQAAVQVALQGSQAARQEAGSSCSTAT